MPATVISSSEAGHTNSPVGGKAAALGALTRAGFPIPPWCVITATPGDPERALLASWAGEATRLVGGASTFFAVRSSAIGEDGAEQSYAGQYDSFLFVTEADLSERIADVRKSGLNARVKAYRQTHDLAGPPPTPAAIVQRMIDPQASGVAFSADPISGRRSIAIVSAVPGVGTGLVSGACDADTYRVDLDGEISETTIATKSHYHRHDAKAVEGVSLHPVASPQAPAITDALAREVAGLARRCQRHFGCPQDIEWALAGDTIYLLQSRPITALQTLADPDAPLVLWDNSNICESYPGLTTPLTFSFARRIYEEVYREFCRMLAVPESDIAANDATFRCMLGLIHGRLYYNLLNWYRVLALLPGFDINRRFMEEMMGVKEPLPEALVAQVLDDRPRVSRPRAWIRVVHGATSLVASHWHFDATHASFLSRLKDSLDLGDRSIESMRFDELVTYYHTLETKLLRTWDAPLINDFLAMIFFGVLRKLTKTWCHCPDDALANSLLATRGGIISAEPARRVRLLAQEVSHHPNLAQTLSTGSLTECQQVLRTTPQIAEQIDTYLEEFGDRCLEELKLETVPLGDDPILLYRTIGTLATTLAGQGESPSPPQNGTPSPPLTIDYDAREQIGNHPLRRVIFRWVLNNTRARVKDRENLRFERTRVFGRVRRILVEIGRRLTADGHLKTPRDVFMLELGEILAFADGTAVSNQLSDIVQARQQEFAEFSASPEPPGRLSTHGAPSSGDQIHQAMQTPTTPHPTDDTKQLQGLGCCAGIVRGRARLITNPADAVILPGEILVAERTDPGWIMLFASAAGVAVERGSLLSHSAIVTREMSIPGVVSVPGLTTWLADGDTIELDGSQGTITKIS